MMHFEDASNHDNRPNYRTTNNVSWHCDAIKPLLGDNACKHRIE